LATLVNTERAELNTVIYHFESIQKILSKFEREASFANVLSISTQYKISAYDAQFVALAMELDLPLITQDKHVLKKIPNLAQSMSQFIS
jgi:predicted nucleic acid-binding protein